MLIWKLRDFLVLFLIIELLIISKIVIGILIEIIVVLNKIVLWYKVERIFFLLVFIKFFFWFK